MSEAEPLTIRGTEYPSLRMAAVSLGVSRNTLVAARKNGTLDYVGYRMPIEVRGTVYPSAKHAAKALKITTAAVYCAVSRRTTERLGLGKGNRVNHGNGGREKQPVKIGNIEFESYAACGRAIGWPAKRVRQAIKVRGPRSKRNLIQAVMTYQAKKDQGK